MKHELPQEGYCCLAQIVGNRKAKPPIPAMIPVSKTTWYKGIQNGIYPKPIHTGRYAMWRWRDIRKLVKRLEAEPFTE